MPCRGFRRILSGSIPDPDSVLLREAFAKRFGCSKSEIFCGNGSDEVLALAFYAFFDPDSGPLLMPDVSYSFYPVFCAFHGLTAHEIPLEADFTIDLSSYSRYAHDHSYAGIILANPNAPTGIALERTELKSLLSSLPDDRVLIVDEAYVDFGAESMVEAIERFENLLVIGTLSKSYSLAGLRLGYAVGQPHLIDALNRAKDSFNSYPVSRIAQELGRIALENTDHFCRCRDELIAIREASCRKITAPRMEGASLGDKLPLCRAAAHSSGENLRRAQKRRCAVYVIFRSRESMLMSGSVSAPGLKWTRFLISST